MSWPTVDEFKAMLRDQPLAAIVEAHILQGDPFVACSPKSDPGVMRVLGPAAA
jgi:hypothetical protein